MTPLTKFQLHHKLNLTFHTLQSYNNRNIEFQFPRCGDNPLGYDVTSHYATKDVNKSSVDLNERPKSHVAISIPSYMGTQDKSDSVAR